MWYNPRRQHMEQIRSFVAIELSDHLKQELREPQALLKSKGITDEVRWVKPEGLHLTLKFLGNVPADKVKEIVVAITQARLGVEPFNLTFGGLGCFPTARRPNVIWVGVEGETESLARLQANIENRLSVLGYPPEKRKYTPHLTLGRVARHVKGSDRRRLGGVIQTQDIGLLGEMKVRKVSLMRSDLSPAGAKHARLKVVKLEG